jgi:NAD(P)-dependent dehydrogenase (short-subunit alcohol dehydrogenase family)
MPTAMVTGASRGIGKAIAVHLAGACFDVALTASTVDEVLPGMLERGSGCIVNITSGAGFHDPPAPAGQGGWGLGYGFSKAALHRVAGILHLELADRGIRAYNVQPGFIATERMAQDMGDMALTHPALPRPTWLARWLPGWRPAPAPPRRSWTTRHTRIPFGRPRTAATSKPKKCAETSVFCPAGPARD